MRAWAACAGDRCAGGSAGAPTAAMRCCSTCIVCCCCCGVRLGNDWNSACAAFSMAAVCAGAGAGAAAVLSGATGSCGAAPARAPSASACWSRLLKLSSGPGCAVHSSRVRTLPYPDRAGQAATPGSSVGRWTDSGAAGSCGGAPACAPSTSASWSRLLKADQCAGPRRAQLTASQSLSSRPGCKS